MVPPHDDRPRAARARATRSAISYLDPDPRRARLGVHRRALRRPGRGHGVPRRGLPCAPTPRYAARVTAPVLWDREDERHRQQRVERDHPHVRARRVRRRRGPSSIRRRSPARSTRSTSASTRPSTTASTAAASPAHRPPTRRRSGRCSRRSTGSRRLLGERRYLLGDALTEADWRLFPTLVRFDAVYYGHFKCNLRRLVDYPNLWGYTRELYQLPGIAATVDARRDQAPLLHTHPQINPTRIVPLGPDDRLHGAARAGLRSAPGRRIASQPLSRRSSAARC